MLCSMQTEDALVQLHPDAHGLTANRFLGAKLGGVVPMSSATLTPLFESSLRLAATVSVEGPF